MYIHKSGKDAEIQPPQENKTKQTNPSDIFYVEDEKRQKKQSFPPLSLSRLLKQSQNDVSRRLHGKQIRHCYYTKSNKEVPLVRWTGAIFFEAVYR